MAWRPDLSRMPSTARADYLAKQSSCTSDCVPALLPHLHLPPHRASPASLSAHDAIEEPAPDEDDMSIGEDGFPTPTALDLTMMEEGAGVPTVAPGGDGPVPAHLDDEQMSADEYRHHFGPILSDTEFEAQLQSASRCSRLDTAGN
eukprot:466671-Pyramimonas_sp.AAC.1